MPSSLYDDCISIFLLRKHFSESAPDFILNYENETVEQLWNSFTSAINKGISKFIPIKRFDANKNLTWITQKPKRLIQKRDKRFQLQKRSKKGQG